jgi:uncharacterized Zn-binding protein involved in type VI secretion
MVVLTAGFMFMTCLNGKASYQDGRVSACADVLSVFKRAGVVNDSTVCIPYKKDAAVKVGEVLFSLDGKKLN